MDPSQSVSNDPHHPPSFTAFSPFTTTNTNSFTTSTTTFFSSSSVNPSAVTNPTNQFFQPPPQSAPVSHPPYSDMICSAIAALNEPEGSSKQAISRYIESNYTGIPPSHGALLTHHLKSLMNSNVLIMDKKSYKFAASLPPTSVAVAAAAASTGLEPPRSDFTSNIVNESQISPDPVVTSTPQTQKRGRGRPPKPKPEIESINVQTNGKPEVETQIQIQSPIRRPPGRPRKDGSSPTVKASVETVKARGRPASARAAGRERKPAVVSAPASVFPYIANGGVRRRGRPKRIDAGSSSIVPPQANAESGGEEKKRGRGRPPKIGGVIKKPLKPIRGYFRTGRSVGRPRKTGASKGPSGQQDIVYGELKKKFELFREKAKDIVTVLKAKLGGSENQEVVQAIQKLEELTAETTEEPQPMEEPQPEELHIEPELAPAPAPAPEPEEGQGHTKTEAEAMQEALF